MKHVKICKIRFGIWTINKSKHILVKSILFYSVAKNTLNSRPWIYLYVYFIRLTRSWHNIFAINSLLHNSSTYIVHVKHFKSKSEFQRVNFLKCVFSPRQVFSGGVITMFLNVIRQSKGMYVIIMGLLGKIRCMRFGMQSVGSPTGPSSRIKLLKACTR